MQLLKQAIYRVKRLPQTFMMASHIDADHTLSTEQLYSTTQPVFTGPYEHVRRQLDYTWHAYYTAERQRIQDEIITQFLRTGIKRIEHPWIVHTAGPMGAGMCFGLSIFIRNMFFFWCDIIFTNILTHHIITIMVSLHLFRLPYTYILFMQVNLL